MPDPSVSASPHDTPFTPADLVVRDAMVAALTEFLKKLESWNTICLKYKYDTHGKNYGQGADALTVIAAVRGTLNDMTVKMLEGK